MHSSYKVTWCCCALDHTSSRWSFSSSERLTSSKVAYFFLNLTTKLFLPQNNHLFVTLRHGGCFFVGLGFGAPPWERELCARLPHLLHQLPGRLGSQVSSGSGPADSVADRGSTLHSPPHPSQRCRCTQSSAPWYTTLFRDREDCDACLCWINICSLLLWRSSLNDIRPSSHKPF